MYAVAEIIRNVVLCAKDFNFKKQKTMNKELREEYQQRTGFHAFQTFNEVDYFSIHYVEGLEQKNAELKEKANRNLLMVEQSVNNHTEVKRLEAEVKRLEEESNNRGEQIRNIKKGLENEGLNWFAESINAPKAEQ